MSLKISFQSTQRGTTLLYITGTVHLYLHVHVQVQVHVSSLHSKTILLVRDYSLDTLRLPFVYMANLEQVVTSPVETLM